MEFISTKNMTNETAPEGQVLVQFLSPFFGEYTIEWGIGYFDNPNDYVDKLMGDGWKLWDGDKCINVVAYAELPNKIKEGRFLSQKEFKEKFGSFHPNLGCVGE